MPNDEFPGPEYREGKWVGGGIPGVDIPEQPPEPPPPEPPPRGEVSGGEPPVIPAPPVALNFTSQMEYETSYAREHGFKPPKYSDELLQAYQIERGYKAPRGYDDINEPVVGIQKAIEQGRETTRVEPLKVIEASRAERVQRWIDAGILTQDDVDKIKADHPTLYRVISTTWIGSNDIDSINKAVDIFNEAVATESEAVAAENFASRQEQKRFEARLKVESPELYQVYQDKGIDAYNAEVGKLNEEYERNKLAISKLEKYTDKDGGVDGSQYLRENKNDVATLTDAGFEAKDIKKWQQYNESMGYKFTEIAGKQVPVLGVTPELYQEWRRGLAWSDKATSRLNLTKDQEKQLNTMLSKEIREQGIQAASLIFEPARVMYSDVTFRDIKGMEWGVGAAQVGLLFSPYIAAPFGAAAKGVELGVQGASLGVFTAATVQEFQPPKKGELPVPTWQKAVSVGFDVLIAGAILRGSGIRLSKVNTTKADIARVKTTLKAAGADARTLSDTDKALKDIIDGIEKKKPALIRKGSDALKTAMENKTVPPSIKKIIADGGSYIKANAGKYETLVNTTRELNQAEKIKTIGVGRVNPDTVSNEAMGKMVNLWQKESQASISQAKSEWPVWETKLRERLARLNESLGRQIAETKHQEWLSAQEKAKWSQIKATAKSEQSTFGKPEREMLQAFKERQARLNAERTASLKERDRLDKIKAEAKSEWSVKEKPPDWEVKLRARLAQVNDYIDQKIAQGKHQEWLLNKEKTRWNEIKTSAKSEWSTFGKPEREMLQQLDKHLADIERQRLANLKEIARWNKIKATAKSEYASSGGYEKEILAKIDHQFALAEARRIAEIKLLAKLNRIKKAFELQRAALTTKTEAQLAVEEAERIIRTRGKNVSEEEVQKALHEIDRILKEKPGTGKGGVTTATRTKVETRTSG